jgi:hypothetical protein
MNLMQSKKSGWAFPPKAKKAHFFNNDGISACEKYTIKWSNSPAYLPIGAFSINELCPKCIKRIGNIYNDNKL